MCDLARCLPNGFLVTRYMLQYPMLMIEGLGTGDEFLMDGGQHFGSFKPLCFFAEVRLRKYLLNDTPDIGNSSSGTPFTVAKAI